MFRQKRSDTTVGTLEDTYGISLNARRDMLLGNVLRMRGFDSLSQLLKAYNGNATALARRRRVFTSFDYDDVMQVLGFRLMLRNPNVALEFTDMGVRAEINSQRGTYLRQQIRLKMQPCSIVLCLIGDATAWSEWVNWELQAAHEMSKGLCGVRLKGSRGRAPQILRDLDAPVAQWDIDQTIAAIECAAARRS
jgi:hypothetical protein